MLLTEDDFDRVCSRPVPERAGRPIVGVDLGQSRSWSAAVALWPSGRIEALAVANGEASIEAQEKRDRVPAGVYRRLFDAGLVTTDGTRRVPRVETVVERLRPWNPDVIVADRFRFDELVDAKPGCPIVARKLMPSEWDFDIRALREYAADGPLACEPGSRALVEASLAVSEVRTNEDGVSKLIKRGARNAARDDVSAALCLAAGARKRAPKPKRGVYHGTV